MEYVIHVESNGISKTNVPRRTNQKKKRKQGVYRQNSTTVIRCGIRPQIAGNMRLIKTRDPRIG